MRRSIFIRGATGSFLRWLAFLRQLLHLGVQEFEQIRFALCFQCFPATGGEAFIFRFRELTCLLPAHLSGVRQDGPFIQIQEIMEPRHPVREEDLLFAPGLVLPPGGI